MQSRMACALVVVSALAWVSLPAAAQVNPAPAQPEQSSFERTPSTQKVLPSPETNERAGTRFFTFTRNTRARTQQILQGPQIQQGLGPGQTEATANLPRMCAHILIYVAPPSADDKMMIKLSREDTDASPTFQGLPPCPRDFRPLFFAALGQELRFMKPGRTDSPLPGLEKPSSLTQPK